MNSQFVADDVKAVFLEAIRRHASLQGKSTEDLGKTLGLSGRGAQLLLRGHTILTFWAIQKLSQELGITWEITAHTNESNPTLVQQEVQGGVS